MDPNEAASELSSLRSTKSSWFNLKYFLLLLNMILVYLNSGLFFYLFTKDFRKQQHFNLKDYPNLRYATQISSERVQSSLEDAVVERSSKGVQNQVLEFGNNLDEELSYTLNKDRQDRPFAVDHKYPALNEVVSMFGQQENPFDSANGQPEKPLKERKRMGLLDIIRNRKEDDFGIQDPGENQAAAQVVHSPNIELNNQINLNQQLNEQSSKKNKTLIKKTSYSDLDSLNKQLSMIYLLLALNNFLNFICLTKDKSHNFLLILTLPSIFTILPLIITKFNHEINAWLFVVYIVIAVLTWVHCKRLKRSTSEQLSQHLTNQIYGNQHFVSLESNPTSTQHFLIPDELHDSCKGPSPYPGKEKTNLISIDKKPMNEQPVALKRIMNLRAGLQKQMTPPPSYDNCCNSADLL